MLCRAKFVFLWGCEHAPDEHARQVGGQHGALLRGLARVAWGGRPDTRADGHPACQLLVAPVRRSRFARVSVARAAPLALCPLVPPQGRLLGSSVNLAPWVCQEPDPSARCPSGKNGGAVLVSGAAGAWPRRLAKTLWPGASADWVGALAERRCVREAGGLGPPVVPRRRE
jgi:hypothetical protein